MIGIIFVLLFVVYGSFKEAAHVILAVPFALTGGVHTGLDAIKGIMAGAHAIQIVSALLSAGPEYLDVIREGLIRYMQELNVESVQELCGCMNHSHSKDPAATERRDYVSILHKWNETKAVPEGLHAY